MPLGQPRRHSQQSQSPQGAVCDMATADDGVALRYARWPANRSPVRGTVVIIHGRTEFIEKYFETVDDLRRRGFAVAAFDCARAGRVGAALEQSAQGPCARLRRSRERPRDDHAPGRAARLPAALQSARALDRLHGRAAVGGPPAHADRADGPVLAPDRACRPLACVPRSASPASSCISGSARPTCRATATQSRRPSHSRPISVTSDRARYIRALAVVDADPSLGVGGATIGWLNAAMRASLRVDRIGLCRGLSGPDADAPCRR